MRRSLTITSVLFLDQPLIITKMDSLMIHSINQGNLLSKQILFMLISCQIDFHLQFNWWIKVQNITCILHTCVLWFYIMSKLSLSHVKIYSAKYAIALIFFMINAIKTSCSTNYLRFTVVVMWVMAVPLPSPHTSSWSWWSARIPVTHFHVEMILMWCPSFYLMLTQCQIVW